MTRMCRLMKILPVYATLILMKKGTVNIKSIDEPSQTFSPLKTEINKSICQRRKIFLTKKKKGKLFLHFPTFLFIS